MSDLIRRIDAMQACQVAPSDEWSKATKGGYNQAATDCAMALLKCEPVPPTLSAAMELPEVRALLEAFKDQNELMRSALEIAKREGINGEIGTTNWDAYYNKVAVSLKRSASALAAIKEPKT